MIQRLAAVARLVPRPDLVLFTGDLTETGAPEEYANFLRIVGGLPLRMRIWRRGSISGRLCCRSNSLSNWERVAEAWQLAA